MNTFKKYIPYLFLTLVFTVAGCADNELETEPKDNNFPAPSCDGR